MDMDMTLKQLADSRRIKYDSLYRKARRKYPSIGWTADTDVSPDIAAELVGKKSAGRKQATKNDPLPHVKQPSAEVREAPAFEWPTITVDHFLAAVIYGHCVLIAYDLTVIFAAPGLIASLLIFAIKHAAVRYSLKSDYENANDALYVCFLLDILAVYGHYVVFQQSISSAYIGRMGPNGVFVSTLILAGVVAFGSWFSLYMLKNSQK